MRVVGDSVVGACVIGAAAVGVRVLDVAVECADCTHRSAFRSTARDTGSPLDARQQRPLSNSPFGAPLKVPLKLRP